MVLKLSSFGWSESLREEEDMLGDLKFRAKMRNTTSFNSFGTGNWAFNKVNKKDRRGKDHDDFILLSTLCLSFIKY